MFRRANRYVSSTFLVLALIFSHLGQLQAQSSKTPPLELPTNIIILFADGATTTQWEFGRYSSELIRKKRFAVTQDVINRGVFGLMTTSSNNAYVTDSAAAASAMSTGHKVNNGSISMSPDGNPLPTLLADAQKRGKQIGLISTATIYDASPAAFSVNVKSRRDYQEIVDQYFILKPHVLMGGGIDYFLPTNQVAGKRKDGRNLLDEFMAQGYQIHRSIGDLSRVQRKPLLGLFAEEDMDFEIDRDPKIQPSLAQMTRAALEALDPKRGFVLFVENESIDTAGHRNDVAALMHDLWAFDDAVKVALEFQKRHPKTLLIVTGDHETGGFSPTYAMKSLSGGKNNQLYVDDVQMRRIAGFKISLQELSDRLDKKSKEGVGSEGMRTYLIAQLEENFPGIRLEPDFEKAILEKQPQQLNQTYVPANLLAQMIARQTGFYWGTSGHTPEPALVAAIGPGASLFKGYLDNTDFAKILRQLMAIK